MARPKIPRKSTSIDMTAMCDVAFLLLSFFILTTKFKPSEAITVTTPSSVASKVAPEKDIVMVTMDKDGKVFLSMDDESAKEQIANILNQTKNLNLNIAAFKKAEFFGTSFSQLSSFLSIPKEDLKGDKLPGIPVDSTKGPNELIEWMQLVHTAFEGKKQPNLLLKGDNLAKYPSFHAVITAFKKNEFLKFQMVTNPEAAPIGSELWKDNQKHGADEEKK
ncbi:MAG: biopolymer transporter ExbD [Sphingobacteriia bacterium]|nr:biopolymer transporter ExbD [Sphingobacteriia bacterium]